MTVTGLSKAYASGALTPTTVLDTIRKNSEQYESHNIFIRLLSKDELQPYLAKLLETSPSELPLWGIPFVLKDNIDLAGIPTTAACETFAYTPSESATVVKSLLSAGAIPVGKANLDQFATGLNGTRSPFGPCRNSFNPDFVSGGSSSGSAVSVALGLASFSLGTDTAGSGRIPAGFNNLLGLKPTRGLVSASGVVPACRSLDCVSILSFNADDANIILSVMEGYDETDAYSRKNTVTNSHKHYGYRTGDLLVGVLSEDDLRFFNDKDYADGYQASIKALDDNGFDFVEIDYAPFDEVARLLYEGPWVAERYIATLPLITDNPAAMNETVRTIIEPGGKPPATALFKAEYRLHALKQRCMSQLEKLDCLLTPTAGAHFTIEQMLENPIQHNSELGYYTNFVNLLDLSAVSVPTKLTSQDMPFGITLVGRPFQDRDLLSIANRIQQAMPLPIGALPIQQPILSSALVDQSRTADIVVCGAHMSGLELNWQLTERGAALKELTTTTEHYSLYKLSGSGIQRPALVEDQLNGQCIEIEIWTIPLANLGSFVNAIPAPLGLGKVNCVDGRTLSGFICVEGGLGESENISKFGGWRSYLNSQ
ncbi:UNVERIFIED_CONTAM: hypothetical protein GTU68_017886 [Idotea baltica]|nr:hypothetical protein [Idotea baltica]